jgi:hypothetical protein
MDRACSTHGRDEKWKQNWHGEPCIMPWIIDSRLAAETKNALKMWQLKYLGMM